jgi:hypothetical protein
MKLLGLPVEIVNLNGDAISLSHPLGMTGNRQMLTIAHEMTVRDIDLAVATLCVGGGLGKACRQSQRTQNGSDGGDRSIVQGTGRRSRFSGIDHNQR